MVLSKLHACVNERLCRLSVVVVSWLLCERVGGRYVSARSSVMSRGITADYPELDSKRNDTGTAEARVPRCAHYHDAVLWYMYASKTHPNDRRRCAVVRDDHSRRPNAAEIPSTSNKLGIPFAVLPAVVNEAPAARQCRARRPRRGGQTYPVLP